MSGHNQPHGHEHGSHSEVQTDALNKVVHPAAPTHVDREFKFSFKKQTVKDENTGEEVKRPPVTLTVPIPTFDGLIADMASGDKVTNFVLDLVEEAIKDQVRAQLSDDDKPVNRQEDLDLSKLTLSYIANLPKSERTGGGIAKETWEEWEKDYISVMVEQRRADPKAEEKVTKAAKLFVGRFPPNIRTDKKVLKFLRDQLAIWAINSPNVEEFGDVFKYLDDRATELMNKDSVSLLEAL